MCACVRRRIGLSGEEGEEEEGQSRHEEGLGLVLAQALTQAEGQSKRELGSTPNALPLTAGEG